MKHELRELIVGTVVIVTLTLLVYFLLFGTWPAQSQTRGGRGSMSFNDAQSFLSGFRALVSIASMIVPAVLLAYYTWKYKPKDAYEAAWLALGWCGLAYIVR